MWELEENFPSVTRFETEIVSKKSPFPRKHFCDFLKRIKAPEHTRGCDLEMHLAGLQRVVI